MKQFFTPVERELAIELGALVYANPFLEQRMVHESRIAGADWNESQAYWSIDEDGHRHSNVEAIAARCNALVSTLHGRILSGVRPNPAERQIYDDLVIYFLYERYREAFLAHVQAGEGTGRVAFYAAFREDVGSYLSDRIAPEHLFACFHQVRRAFHQIFRNIAGRTRPVAALRATVWQSIFTYDVRRYRRSLWARMSDVSTLITGPTGTGKELVARAIGYSRYISFDPRRERFAGSSALMAVNLSALSPTLIESELFGHRRGSFTGATVDREGFLESCGPLGTVFLDEIGEVDPAIQVKLLRVIQSRVFQRLGDIAPRAFEGKLIAATNRDLSEEMAQGKFRADFFYRLCADSIQTPSLREQLAGSEDELRYLVQFICLRVAGEEEATSLATEVLRAIEVSPGLSYQWPGNFRELEQCVRSVMLRGTYVPRQGRLARDARQRVAAEILAGTLSMDALLSRYCTLLYASSGNYSEVAATLGIDRRTVRSRVDQALLKEILAG